jgi:hypothetical protein
MNTATKAKKLNYFYFSVPREGKRTQIMQKNEDLSLARVITRVNSSQNSLLTCINNMVFTYVKKFKLVFWLSIHFVPYIRFSACACAIFKLKEYGTRQM